MKRFIALLALTFCSHGLNAQFPANPGGGGGGMPMTPRGLFAGNMSKVFGENSAFTANMLVESKGQAGMVSFPGKVFFLSGKSRFEMDATKIKGANLPPGASEQIKAMGMAEVQSITLPEKKESYLVYPGLKSYAVIPIENDKTTPSPSDHEKTELGKETVDGHPATKYKVLIKDDQGKPQEMTLWSASDLKGFPVKIIMSNNGNPSTISFSDVKLGPPDASLFVPPSGFERYGDVNAMMREAMMKRLAPGRALPEQ